jgi:hypothetical protein
MFSQHRLIGISVYVLFMASIAHGDAIDTLTVSHEFISPIPNPTAIEWDGHSFWTSNMKRPYVYKVDESMIVVDSIYTSHSRISAIAFRNTDLWIAIDSVAKDTLAGNNMYKIFRFYRINIQTGGTVDSVSSRANWVNVGDTGYVCGLAIHNDSFYITINAGYSSGLYFVDAVSQTTKLIDYLPLSGISVIENRIWGIRRTANGSEGNWVTDLVRKDISPLALTFYATDIASNGTYLLICNMRNSKLVQIQLDALNVKRNSFSYRSTNHNAQFGVRLFIKGNNYGMETSCFRFNMKGQRFTTYSHSYNNHATQISIQATKQIKVKNAKR